MTVSNGGDNDAHHDNTHHHLNTMTSNNSEQLVDNSLDNRAYELVVKLFDKNSELNLDSILDSLQSIYFEIKNSNVKSSGYEYYSKKFQDAIDCIHHSRVNIDDFERLKLLGQGGFGKVELVRHKTTNNIYAMKTMNKSLLLRSNQSAFFLEERHIMALSNSPWLVKLYYAFISKDDIYMVMDFMQGGDLINLMSSYDLPMGWVKFYAAEAAIAINALHEFGFIHLDVKPDNMLLNNNGHLKLCDFGTCVNVRKNGIYTCNFAVGTPDYISPEMLASHNKPTKISKATDWWSYAVFLYELLFEETPFACDSLIGTYTKIANFTSSLTFPDKTSTLKPACNLISRLLVVSNERPGFEDVKSDEFFVNDEWNFDNIHESPAAFVPEIKDLHDTTHFDDISDSSNVTPHNMSKSTTAAYSRVGGDHLNFVGFSFNPSMHNNSVISQHLEQARQPPASQLNVSLDKSPRNKSLTEEVVEGEIVEFKEKLATYQKLLNDMETQNTTLSQHKNDINIQLQNVSLQLQQASDKNHQLQAELEVQLSKATVNHAETQKCVTQISHLTSQMDAEREKCRQLEDEKAQFELKYNDFEHDSMTLQKNYGGVERKLKEIKVKYEQTLVEMDRLTTELEQEKQRNLCLNKSIDNGHIDSATTTSLVVGKQIVNSNDLLSPAVLNRTAIMRGTQSSSDNVPTIQQQQQQQYYSKESELSIELQQLKEVIKQSTETECKIKNDLRLITNENERLKQELHNTLDNIKNNPEFLQLEHKCKSLQSYVNLYTKQVKDLNSRVDTLRKDSVETKNNFDKQTLEKIELESQLKTSKTKYLSETTKNKELNQEVELTKLNHTFQLNELQKQHTAALAELETTRKSLFEHENKVIDLTTTLANISISNATATTNNESTDVIANESRPAGSTKTWSELYELEKMKKDQAIKKLDEMIFLFNKKGKSIKPVIGHTTTTQDTKTTKKLQMELRNERLRYEKLLLEKQAALFEYNETLSHLENKVNRLKDRNEQLESLMKTASVKPSVGSNSSPLVLCDHYHRNEHGGSDHVVTKIVLNTSSCCEQTKYSMSHGGGDHLDVCGGGGGGVDSDAASDNDPFYSTISTAADHYGSSIIGGQPRFIPFNSKPYVHFESYVWLIPYNKLKRASRKLPWKKYYAILTYSHFVVYTEKVEKENPKKLFKKISLEHIKKACQITHEDLRKADPKDITKIFSIKYYDEDLANVTTKLESKSSAVVSSKLESKTSVATTSKRESKVSSLILRAHKKSPSTSNELSAAPNSIDFKSHHLLMSPIDNEPFCGACSLNLSTDTHGEHLKKCYECKFCNLKFHFFHVTSTNDNSISECSKIPPNVSSAHQDCCLNDNFIVDMFILTPSHDDRTRWVYSFNQLAHINKSSCDINSQISETDPADKLRLVKRKSSLLSKLSVSSKSKGFSTS